MSKPHVVPASRVVVAMLGAVLLMQLAFLAVSSDSRKVLAPLAGMAQSKKAERSLRFDEFDPDDVPVWKPPPGTAERLLAAFPTGRGEGLQWARASRAWRRGIPAVVTTLDNVTAEAVLEGAEHGETWVQWSAAGCPATHDFFWLFATTPALANEVMGDDVEWVLFGDDDTVFNLDVLLPVLQGMDPDVPTVMTDHLWYSHNGNGPLPGKGHGSRFAPRCVPCGVEVPPTPGYEEWRPPQACPACTWELLNASDPTRHFLTEVPEGSPGVVLRRSDPAFHGGAGHVLSRGLVRMLNQTYMRDCYRDKRVQTVINGGDALFSRCVTLLDVAPTETGSFARDERFPAFGPLTYQARGAIDDAYWFSRDPRCCKEDCRTRLNSTVTLHIRSAHSYSPAFAREVVRSVARSRDLYQAALALEKHGVERKIKGLWDTKEETACL